MPRRSTSSIEFADRRSRIRGAGQWSLSRGSRSCSTFIVTRSTSAGAVFSTRSMQAPLLSASDRPVGAAHRRSPPARRDRRRRAVRGRDAAGRSERLARIRTQAYERLRSCDAVRAAGVRAQGGARRARPASRWPPTAREERSAAGTIEWARAERGDRTAPPPASCSPRARPSARGRHGRKPPAVTIVVALAEPWAARPPPPWPRSMPRPGSDAEIPHRRRIRVTRWPVAHDWVRRLPIDPVAAGPGAQRRCSPRRGGHATPVSAAAREATVLVLDGGTGLYPRGLAALAAALDQDEQAVLTYPLDRGHRRRRRVCGCRARPARPRRVGIRRHG